MTGRLSDEQYFAELARQNGSLDDHWPDAPLSKAPPGTFDPDAAAADLEPDNGHLRLEVLTAAELVRLPDPDRSDELLGPLLVRGYRTVIGAHTGDGKTTIALRMIKAVLEHGPFLDWHGQGDGRVLVLDLEQGLRSIKRRLREAGLDQSDRIDYARIPDGLILDKSDRQRAAVEELLATGGYAVVVIDPLYKAHAGESNDDRQMLALLRHLDGWRERFRFALLLPVHCRKPPPGVKFSIHDLFGSSVVVRGAEVVLGLTRVDDGYSRLHFFKDRDGDLPIGRSWGLLFSPEDGYRRDPKDDDEPRDLDHDVRAHLAAHPGEWLTARELARKEADGGIGAGRERVLAVLEALRTAGIVEYAKGPEGRNVNADCYRLHEVARPSRPPEPPPREQGLQEGRWLGGLAGSIEPGHPEATSRPPGGGWLDPPAPPEPPDEADLDEADRIQTAHADLMVEHQRGEPS